MISNLITYPIFQRLATIISVISDAYTQPWTSTLPAPSLVHSKLDHCNSLYYSLPQSQLKRLQAFQLSLACCVTSSSRFQHITPGLKSLHWLKAEQRIQNKLISLTYSYLQHNSPLYLQWLLTTPTNHRSTVLHRSSLFSSHPSNWKQESVHFLLQHHVYGTLFQTRCASPLLMTQGIHSHCSGQLSLSSFGGR